MAMLVFDVTAAPPIPLVGDKVARIARLTMDTDYATGGYSLTAANLGLSSIDQAIIPPASGFVFEYDYTNAKVKAFMGDNDGVADGALTEVTTGLNALDTVATRALFIGEEA